MNSGSTARGLARHCLRAIFTHCLPAVFAFMIAPASLALAKSMLELPEPPQMREARLQQAAERKKQEELAKEQEARRRQMEQDAAAVQQEQARLVQEKERQKNESAELQRKRRQMEQEQAALSGPPARAVRSGEGPYGREYQDPVTGMAFVWVPPGSFDMGDTFGEGYEWEKPIHRVRLQGFYLGRYAVSQGEWEQIMGANPSKFRKGPRYPVERVSWDMVQDFIGKLNRQSGRRYSLPSEAQWEYAASWRADGSKARFGTGKDSIGPDEANFDANVGGKEPYSRVGEWRRGPVAVESFSPNGLGLYQMSGNVWEWVQDCWHASYEGAPTDGSAWEGDCSESARVYRGGGWFNYPRILRSTNRFRFASGFADDYHGFRLVLPVH